jgi:hypothetical protein
MPKRESIFNFDIYKAIHDVSKMGVPLAMIISWSVNKSILWAMLHGIFSWFYVVYYAFVR